MQNKLIYGIVIGAFLVMLGRGFMLHSDKVFGFHDITQAGRVSEFVVNLLHFQIPPRIAPTFSYEMGYPMFNHYAPTAYWITSGLSLAGASASYAVKLSLFLAVVVAGLSMFFFAREHFSREAALVAGALYASSPLVGIEVFVRGNLAEMWFLALFPLVLYLVHRVSKVGSPGTYVALACMFSLLLTSHNALSIIGGAIVLMYGLISRQKKVLFALILGGSISAYFLVPAVFELSQTHATELASETNYADHFVCLKQLWNSPHAFGGSIAGCTDGMSFQLGKFVVLGGLVGVVLFLYSLVMKRRPMNGRHVLILVMGISSLFLTLTYAQGIWRLAEPVLSLFQFPWRFLVFVLFSASFFSGYATDWLGMWAKQTPRILGVIAVSIGAFFLSIPFFTPNPDALWSAADFRNQYLTHEYLRNEIAYRVPEYLPLSADVAVWRSLQETPTDQKPPSDVLVPLDGELFTVIQESPFGFTAGTSSKSFMINKFAAPHLRIMLDGEDYTPISLDSLGRPLITSDKDKVVVDVSYVQTPLQKVANVITLIASMLLVLPYTRTWKKMS